MSKKTKKDKENKENTPSVFSLLKDYRFMVVGLILLGIAANALTLVIPKLIEEAIDTYESGVFDFQSLIIEFTAFSFGILFFTYLQTIVQTYASEKVAMNIRGEIVRKISRQEYRFIEEKNPSKLLTNITSDIDSIKDFVSQAVVSLVSSVVIIIGTVGILLATDWKLALTVLTIIPVIGITFFLILRLVRTLFKQSREVIDSLNKIINESIIGASLIRVLNSENFEHAKFSVTNSESRNLGTSIIKLFAFMIPIITFVSSVGTLMVVVLGGYYVINDEMTLGAFVAFNSYIAILIFPILIIGFISNIIAQASASYERIYEVLSAPDTKDEGTITTPLEGKIEVKDVNIMYGEKSALSSVSLTILPQTKTAIIGPTGAGKTQLLNVMTGLTDPQSGSVSFDGHLFKDYESKSFYPQVGLVFQDSVLFNTTVRENIAFSNTVTDESLRKAIETAELDEFTDTLPNGLDTIVSERGTSLSGGQKQRLMLARALALNPKILFLDDFTARVDSRTEQSILKNIETNYPDLTLISITQKIAPIENYDQIILIMEGEILARGTHQELMSNSPEYMLIYNSQRSTNAYELRT